jgi:hypothetical protein
MTDQAWWAAGFALLSLVLGVGWSWLRPKNRSWQNVEEQWPGWAARFFYFVGLPYLAVISGVLSTRLLGLKGLEYFILIDVESASENGRLVAEIQYASLLMLLEWFVDSSSTIVAGLVALLVLAGVTVGLARAGVMVAGGSHMTVTGVIYYGLHWAFYRAVFWLITGDLYLGVVWGAALVMLEAMLAMLAARVRGNWNDQQPQFLLNSIILILTATVFFYSPNLWLLWLVHGAMVAQVRLLGVVDRGRELSQTNPA